MEKKINIIKRIFLIAIAMVSILAIAKTQNVYAADTYKAIELNDGGIYKVGKYYLKYVYNEQKLYVGNSQNGEFTLTPMPTYGLFSNGKTVYYIKDKKLCQYNLANKKAKNVKKLSSIYSSDDDAYVSIKAYYGGNFYITKSSFEKWKYTTYYYNLSSKKLKLAKDECCIQSQKGKYVLVTSDYRTDVSTGAEYVFQLTKTGMKEIKKLTNNGLSATFVGKNIYYVDYPKTDMKKAVLYKTTITGKSKTKIATFTTKQEYDQVIVSEITSKNCKVNMNSTSYLYTYKTKKLKKIG